MITLISQNYLLFLFIHLSVVFILMKQGSGWSWILPPPPAPRPAFLSLNYFSLVLSFLFSVPERLENLVKVGQTLLRKHSGSGVGRIRIRGSSDEDDLGEEPREANDSSLCNFTLSFWTTVNNTEQKLSPTQIHRLIFQTVLLTTN